VILFYKFFRVALATSMAAAGFLFVLYMFASFLEYMGSIGGCGKSLLNLVVCGLGWFGALVVLFFVALAWVFYVINVYRSRPQLWDEL
jgi:type III secretory pathway component EscU